MNKQRKRIIHYGGDRSLSVLSKRVSVRKGVFLTTDKASMMTTLVDFQQKEPERVSSGTGRKGVL